MRMAMQAVIDKTGAGVCTLEFCPWNKNGPQKSTDLLVDGELYPLIAFWAAMRRCSCS